MNKTVLCLAFVALCASALGQLTDTFGFVTAPDGSRRSVDGMSFPITLERIDANEGPFWRRERRKPGFNWRFTSAQAYLNDSGEPTYFVSGLPAPSVLDDLNLAPVGHNAPWSQLMCGINIGSTEQVILRWVIYDTDIGNQGAGNSQFQGVLHDFGGFFNPATTPGYNGPGTYKITFGIAAAGAVVPDGECYVGFQVREPDPSGNGPFMPSWGWVFSGGGVGAGSSNDLFWYDHDPAPNGIYEGTEADHFGGPPSEANLLLGIVTSGTPVTMFPTSITMLRGTQEGGSFVDLWYSDDTDVHFKNLGPDVFNLFTIRIEVATTSPTTNLVSLTFTIESSSIYDPSAQRVSLFNYALGQYVEIAATEIIPTDTSISVTIPTNPSDYINPSNRQMKALIEVRRMTERMGRGDPFPPRSWSAWMDQVQWTGIRP